MKYDKPELTLLGPAAVTILGSTKNNVSEAPQSGNFSSGDCELDD